MRVSVIVEQDINEDGVDQEIYISRDGVETVEDILYLFRTVLDSMGFSYIKNLSAHTNTQEITTDW